MNYEEEIKKVISEISYYKPNEFDNNMKGCSEAYIYGAGFMGCKYAEILIQSGFTILGYFETECGISEKTTQFNIQVFPVTYQEKPVIISSFKYYVQMKTLLIQKGYRENQIISPFGVFEKFYLPKFEKAFNSFEDELSKNIVMDKIKCLTLDTRMHPVSAYFSSEIFRDRRDEVFVDGGAFDGETAKEFAYAMNRNYKKIYCFEPTRSNYELTIKNLQNFENIQVINQGLYSDNKVLQFKDFGTDDWNAVDDYFMDHRWNGLPKDYKLVDISVTSLDLFFQDVPKNEYPTIIKLDIEGSEKEALIGMRHILNTSHP